MRLLGATSLYKKSLFLETVRTDGYIILKKTLKAELSLDELKYYMYELF